ncbi:heavy metal translocating P-type ATPase [Capilliphycus salinus ALCB114379]|uniref:heavy metal translocating P-type ATPase n=1 Tax=Capilliphycus salinus TaxID=2768948 RepID=UPI0039A4CD49
MQLAPKTEIQQVESTSPQQSKETIILDVGGMKCAGCVSAVERQLTQQTGVISARVNLATEVATVECETNTVDTEEFAQKLAQKLTDTGFPSQPRSGSRQTAEASENLAQRHRQEIRQQIRRVVTCGLLILLSGIGHLHHLGFGHLPILNNIWFHWGLATIALLFPGRTIIIDGIRSLLRNAPNMNTLVGLGTLTAYTTSFVALLFPQLGWECFFDEPVMLLGFILLGKTLEQQARHRATNALQSLIALQPTMARLVPQPQEDKADKKIEQAVEIPAEKVRIGECLQVLPGEKIPVDGEIFSGKTTVNESMLTGESMPVVKQSGDLVSAGTINQSGAIIIQATRTAENTTLAHIVSLVENAQTRKAPIQNLADKVAGYFTYTVMSLAALTFLFWYGIGTKIWPDVINFGASELASHASLLLSMKLAVAVLVIACPCALGLATPTAILVGSGIGAERGLLIKGGDILERVHQLDTVVFDKTGTLTTGHPTVTDCLSIDENSTSENLLQLAATVEQGSTHPIAKALVNQAQKRELSLLSADDFQTEAGLGVSANVNGKRVWVGNQNWLIQQGIEFPEHTPKVPGKTAVYVAVEKQFVGLIAVSDPLKEDAKSTVKQLQKIGLNVIILTGDRAEVAKTIAEQLELPPENVLAEVRPDGKAKAIGDLQQQGQRVAMVGDGINDAPALAQANVGIGLHTGTDVAMETADIVLMRESLMDVVESIRLSRSTFNKIRQNLFWAFGYNTLGIPVAAGLLLPTFGIILSPATAGAFMAFSSVSVVTNSLLLRRKFS